MVSRLSDVDNTLKIRGPETETAPIQLEEETCFASLLTSPTAPPELRERA